LPAILFITPLDYTKTLTLNNLDLTHPKLYTYALTFAVNSKRHVCYNVKLLNWNKFTWPHEVNHQIREQRLRSKSVYDFLRLQSMLVTATDFFYILTKLRRKKANCCRPH